jgi:hypothetical protein
MSLARIPKRVTNLGPELYKTIFVFSCLLAKKRLEWCRYCTLLSHGHISYLLNGWLEAEAVGHTTSEFPQNNYTLLPPVCILVFSSSRSDLLTRTMTVITTLHTSASDKQFVLSLRGLTQGQNREQGESLGALSHSYGSAICGLDI